MADITTAGLWMLILQGVSSLLMLLIGLVLKLVFNTLRDFRNDLQDFSKSVKALNDLVLGEYAPRKVTDRLQVDIDNVATSLREIVAKISDRVARIEGNRHVE